MTTVDPIVLASGSRHRAEMLENAGLSIVAEAARIDERVIEAPLLESDLQADDIAQVLAEAKALDVSDRHGQSLVIGCDQTLSLDGQLFHKPEDMQGARKHLLAFSGKTHQLNSAIVLVRNGETLWRHVGVAHMSMRQLSPKFVGQYLAKVGDVALSSVGAYQIEAEGVQLFDRIDGDYFTIVGLPLLPLLEKLRQLEILDG